MLCVTALCPLVCRLFMVTPGERGTRTAQTSESAGEPCDGCPWDEPGRQAPEDPCEGVSCFCSPFAMHDPSNSVTSADRELTPSFLGITQSSMENHAGTTISGLAADRTSPTLTATSPVVLPLLI